MEYAEAHLEVDSNATVSITATGECIGNDLRCKGKVKDRCAALGNEGADCEWVENEAEEEEEKEGSDATDSTPPTGECVGNDSRCKGSVGEQCIALGGEGADCKWEEYSDTKDSGSCVGNDSRCQGSRHATCYRLESHGSDCRWKSSIWTSGPDGKCVGGHSKWHWSTNASKCSDLGEVACNMLTNSGADCRWRGAFSVTGSMTITVSGADAFVDSGRNVAVIDGMIDGIANFTGVPAAYVDVDLAPELDRRRLRSPQLEQSKDMLLTYAIAVSGEAPESVVATGSEVRTKLTPENRDAIEDAMSSHTGTDFDFNVKSMSTPQVTLSSNPQGSLEANLSPHNGVMRLVPLPSFVICSMAGLLMA